MNAYIKDYLGIYGNRIKETIDVVIEDAGAYFTEAYNEAEGLPPDSSASKMIKWAVLVDLVLIVRPLKEYIKDGVRREDKDLALRIHQIIEERARNIFRDRVVVINSESLSERMRVALKAIKALGLECLNDASLISS